MAPPKAASLTEDQKLALIAEAQKDIRERLGLDPTKSVEQNIAYMKEHPDAEVRRRYGNLGTTPSTYDSVTGKQGLGEQGDLVAFALRDFSAEAAGLEASYAKPKFIEDKLRRSVGYQTWVASVVSSPSMEAEAGGAEGDEPGEEGEEMDGEPEASGPQDGSAPVENRATPPSFANRPDGIMTFEAFMSHPVSDEGGRPSAPAAPLSSSGTPERVLSRDEFMALPPEGQIQEIQRAQAIVDGLLKNPGIRPDSYEGKRLKNASAQESPVSTLNQTPSTEEPGAQAYRVYYNAQEAIEFGQKALNKRVANVAQNPSAPSVEQSGDAGLSGGGRRRNGGEGRRSPEQRLEHLERLQKRVSAALGDGRASGWTEEQRTQAQEFVGRDLNREALQDRQTRREIRQEAQMLRQALKGSAGVEPVGAMVSNRGYNAEGAEGPQGEELAGGRNGGEGRRSPEQRLERLERLQVKVRNALHDGTTDQWTHAEQAQAANFSIRNLREEMHDPQKRTEIAQEARALRGHLKGANAEENRAAPDLAGAFSGPSRRGWNDSTYVPAAEPARYEVTLKPTQSSR